MDLNKLDWNKLRTFLLVANTRGITSAAERLGVTRSAVSQSVSALERTLGVALFHRMGRRIALTVAGRDLHGHLDEYHAQLLQSLDAIVNPGREVRGLVRVGLFLGFSRLRLARLLRRFTGQHPETRVKLLYAPHGELHAHLLNDRVDFVFSLSPFPRAGRSVRSTCLLRQELVLAGAPRLCPRVPEPAALGRLPIIDYYQGDPLVHRWLRHHYGAATPDPAVRVWAATTDLVLELLLGGAGLGVLPRDLAQPFVRARRLGVVETARPPLTDSVWLCQLAPRYPNALLDAFRTLIDEEVARPGGARAAAAGGRAPRGRRGARRTPRRSGSGPPSPPARR